MASKLPVCLCNTWLSVNMYAHFSALLICPVNILQYQYWDGNSWNSTQPAMSNIAADVIPYNFTL